MSSLLSSDIIKVLVIDDDKSVLDGIRRIIKVKCPNWDVSYVSSPVDALLMYRREKDKWDVVVCDYEMPYFTGDEVMGVVRENTPRVGIVTLSGRLDGPALVKGNKYSDMHLCKPVEVEILCECIMALYRLKQDPN